jgi:chromosome partitioning protein
MPDVSASTRIIALMNQKGGVGKTTTSVNLAAALARAGKRVLLIDLDPQAHASIHLGIDPATLSSASEPPGAGSVYDVMIDVTVSPEAVWRQVRENLWVLPAETDLAAAETELATEADRTSRLRSALEPLLGKFDYVLLDCPPSLGVLTLNALAMAREVFIPMQAHFLALQGVSKLLQTVQLVSQQVNPRLRVTGVILCMHDAALTHSKEVVADLEAFFEQARADATDTSSPWKSARVLSPAIRRNVKLAECPSFGQTIFDYAPDCPGALDYEALARKMIAEWDVVLARRGSSGATAGGSNPEVKVHMRGASKPAAADRGATT